MPSAIQLKRTKYQLVNPDRYLNHELSKAVTKPLPLFSRLLAGGISLLFFGTLTWAAVSKVDEVASAQAEVIPSSRVNPVRSIAGGLLRSVDVKAGQQVKAGDPLVQLDPTISEAEYDRIGQQLQSTQENLARLEAEWTGQTAIGFEFQNALLAASLRESQATINRQQGVIQAAKAELNRLQATLTYAGTKERSLRMLVVHGAVPRLSYLDARSQTASIQAEIDAKRQEIYQGEQELERLKAARQTEILTQINQLTQERNNLEKQLQQAEAQHARDTIIASTNGTVYDVKVSESGVTVQAGEELLSIVPQGEELVVEAKILNRDIGFIHPGMQVNIKLETFPYQEFGTLRGKVTAISANAVNDQQLGLVYPSRIKLDRQTVRVNGEDVQLAPGMIATAEIVTRQKTILSFLIEPLISHFDQAFSIR